MNRRVAALAARVAGKTADRFADEIAFRVALETMFNKPDAEKTPQELFSHISDDFWFWLFTRGSRRSPIAKEALPGLPSEEVQLNFTGASGDAGLKEAFQAYVLMREMYVKHVGRLDQSAGILDFGCGWGRLIRFFLKDVESARLWGVDPVAEMIDLCRRHNRWCNFTRIGHHPPMPFANETFDMVYSYSVFSHFSEKMHEACLVELRRVLKPGGLLIATTRPREFIQECSDLRRSKTLAAINPGPRSSASAFTDTERFLAIYDSGEYCFSQLVFDGDWSYWGEAAVSEAYVMSKWTDHFNFLDYIDDRAKCRQNVIVMQKPMGPSA